MWNVVKIIVGILMILGALGNLRHVGGMRSAELMGYLAATSLIFIIGVALLIWAYKSIRGKDNLSINRD